MVGERVSNTPVRTKVVLVDPGSMRVVWMNEAASAAFAQEQASHLEDIPLGELIPCVPGSSAADAVREVADTGVPKHVRADVVTTGTGSLAMVTSIYRTPDGRVLAVTENTWLLDRERSIQRHASESKRRR